MYLNVSDLHANVSVLDISENMPDRDPQAIYVSYSSVLSVVPYHEQLLKINFSVRAFVRKAELVCQQDLLSIVLKDTRLEIFKNSFYLRAIPLEQVMLEKLFVLQEMFMQKEMPSLYYVGKSRHIYDLVKMVDQFGLDLIHKDASLFKALNVHRKYWLYHKKWRPLVSGLNEITLEPSLGMLGTLMEDYMRMRCRVITDSSYSFIELIGRLMSIGQSLSQKALGN